MHAQGRRHFVSKTLVICANGFNRSVRGNHAPANSSSTEFEFEAPDVRGGRIVLNFSAELRSTLSNSSATGQENGRSLLRDGFIKSAR